MISSSDLLNALHDAGVSVTTRDGDLTLHPGFLVPPDLVPMIRKHKQEIITALRSRPSRAEVLQRLATMEPCSHAEADLVRRLQAQGWTRLELVTLLNEDSMRREWCRGRSRSSGAPG